MLRVEFHDGANTLTMRIEGRFVGKYAIGHLWRGAQCPPPKFAVDVKIDTASRSAKTTTRDRHRAMLPAVTIPFYGRDEGEFQDGN